MARKKKTVEKIEYPWSKYQLDIFDYIEHGQGHLVVEAAAGSGKTSTLVKSLELIPENQKNFTNSIQYRHRKRIGKENQGLEKC